MKTSEEILKVVIEFAANRGQFVAEAAVESGDLHCHRTEIKTDPANLMISLYQGRWSEGIRSLQTFLEQMPAAERALLPDDDELLPILREEWMRSYESYMRSNGHYD